MSHLVHSDDTNFEAEVLQSALPVLVDFSAAWCGPCQRLQPIIEELAEEYTGRVKVVHVDVDKAQQTAAKYGIMSVPTLKFMKDGQIVDEALGLMSKEELTQRLERLLAA